MPDVTTELAKRRLHAKAQLKKSELAFPKRPSYDTPVLPERLTQLGDETIMRLLVRFTRYQDYATGLLVEAEIDERAAENLLDLVRAKRQIAAWGGSSTDRVTIAKAEAVVDPEVQSYTDALEMIRARRKLYGVIVEAMSRGAATVSREVTRRCARENVERRTDRMSP